MTRKYNEIKLSDNACMDNVPKIRVNPPGAKKDVTRLTAEFNV